MVFWVCSVMGLLSIHEATLEENGSNQVTLGKLGTLKPSIGLESDSAIRWYR